MKSVLLGVEDGRAAVARGLQRLRGQSGRHAAGLQALYAADQRQGRAHRRRAQVRLLARRRVHRSRRPQRQALAWCDRLNGQPHADHAGRARERLAEERLRPLPTDWAWERFATEERKVSWDGYLSYDGVLYGLPAPAGAAVPWRGAHGPGPRAGRTARDLVRRRSASSCAAKRARSRAWCPHPDQFRGVAAAAAAAVRSDHPTGAPPPAPRWRLRDSAGL